MSSMINSGGSVDLRAIMGEKFSYHFLASWHKIFSPE
jgi:hypothetical protein